MRRILLLAVFFASCAPRKAAYVSTVEKYAAELCACTDSACMQRVNETYAPQMSKQVGAVPREQADAVAKASARVAECLKRLGAPAQQ